MVKKRQRPAEQRTNSPSRQSGSTPVFMDHVRELQWRLAVVALAFLVTAAAVYPFFDKIVALLLKPLGGDLSLVYLTPGGAFNFAIQVCIYAAAIGTLPVALYHSYRFVMPAIERTTFKSVLGYSLSSLLLAASGVTFSYTLALPAAIHFLTSFNLKNISPMLTIDSYLSFVMTYILAGALLFQLPLIMVIINRIKPLTPPTLMAGQRHIILGSVIFAAVISPTPDAVNQLLLAAPIIVMYQLGIVVVMLKNRRRKSKVVKDDESIKSTTRSYASSDNSSYSQQVPVERPTVNSLQPAATPISPVKIEPSVKSRPVVKKSPQHTTAMRRSVDGFTATKRNQSSPVYARPKVVLKPDQVRRPSSRSVDGFLIPSRPVSISVPSRVAKPV